MSREKRVAVRLDAEDVATLARIGAHTRDSASTIIRRAIRREWEALANAEGLRARFVAAMNVTKEAEKGSAGDG